MDKEVFAMSKQIVVSIAGKYILLKKDFKNRNSS